MHLQLFSTIVVLSQLARSTPFLEGRDACSTDDLNLPSGGMQGYNGIYWGFAPDDIAGTSMSKINGDTGKKASTYGRYSQMGSTTSYTGDQLLSVMDDVVSSGAVFVPSIMPTGPTFAEISTDIASDIANVLNQFTSKGVEVWLRFAHEVNCYAKPHCAQPMYPGGSQADFIAAWQRVHAAVASNPKILMFWSPNNDTVETLQGWFPGPNYVDIVGIDIYPSPDTTFDNAYGDFYNTFAKGYNKHFCIGETGAANGGSVSDKEAWVKQLANTDVSDYPCYKSTTWFEYDKGVDFRIIEGQSAATVTETLSNFA